MNFIKVDPETANKFKDLLTHLYRSQYENADKREKKVVNNLLLFKAGSVGRRAWDWFIIFTAMYATLTNPIQLAWEDTFG